MTHPFDPTTGEPDPFSMPETRENRHMPDAATDGTVSGALVRLRRAA